MSDAQPTDPQPPQADVQPDTTQQVTSESATTRPKNPKRVAAKTKRNAAKTKQAREAQKRALDEANA